jgi:hypothetical protein
MIHRIWWRHSRNEATVIEQVLRSGMRAADLLPPAQRAGASSTQERSTQEISQRIAARAVKALNTRMAYFAV